MEFLFVGCSMTWGDELEDRFNSRYSKIVSDALGANETNIAQCGQSNDWIARRTVEETRKKRYDRVYVQLTVPSRMEYFTAQGMFHNSINNVLDISGYVFEISSFDVSSTLQFDPTFDTAIQQGLGFDDVSSIAMIDVSLSQFNSLFSLQSDSDDLDDLSINDLKYGFNVDSYNILPNNRTTDKDPINFGHIHGIAKAVISPLMDILNPTRKENVIGNSRINGNVNSGNYGGHIFNERDTTKVTNREMTTNKIGMNYSNIQNQSENNNGLTVAQYQTIQNQRTSTNKEFVGNPSSKNHGTRTYEAAYNQKNNVNKTYEIHNNPGNMSLFNNSNNVQIVKNENMLKQTRNLLPNGGPNMIPSSEFMGELNGIQTYDYNYNSNRMDESLLDAFKSNPYTKSLTSAA